ncbi:TIGR03085 family protein [Kocuria polaris]|nr:TIGR03085 family protein [Kocuria polaris]
MRFVPPSREMLAETLLAAGPSAETLCDGWECRHLAAHLVLREHHALAAGIAGGPLEKPMQRLLHKWADEARSIPGYRRLVARFAAGPSSFSPFSIGPVERAANLTEFFVHTEDIRRAHDTWAPRVLDREYSERLWSALTRVSSLLFRKAEVGVILVRPDGKRYVAKKSATSVAITGEPAELLMFGSGRRSHALVTLEGADDALALLAEAPASH